MLKNVMDKLEALGPEFRAAPFWSWNSKLEPKELRRQIRLMKQMGLGGFFMHARTGLNTPYLSKEWFECIKACIDESKKIDMVPWLYDEDRWPSGSAGGTVTKDRKYRMRKLQMSVYDKVPSGLPENFIAAFAAVTKGICAESCRKFDIGKDKLKKGEKLLAFSMTVDADSSWFNGSGYVDTLNPEAIQKFIRITHESYKREIPADLGTRVPGIFTDEPSFFSTCKNGAPWTEKLPETFRKMNGYDLLDHLPEIFFKMGKEVFSKVRLDFYNTVTDMFTKAFAKQVGEWCGKNGLAFTGHVLYEDTPSVQARFVGSCMRFYEYQQVPGMDLLTEYNMQFNTAKQVSSAAHQFGRPRRISETYGCTGWDFPFMGHKALADWQYAMGINLMCPHLAWYSMAAEAKRDYPASIFYQSPWYRDYSMVQDYFARIGTALSEGEEQRDLLFIHPIESTWGLTASYTELDEGNIPVNELQKAVQEEDLAFAHLSNALLGAHLDFDFGEEEIMSRWAKVSGKLLTINKAAYKAVILPKMRTIRKTTLDLLVKFRKAGGAVFYFNTIPEFVDGVSSVAAKKAYASFKKVDDKTLSKELSASSRRVSITDKHGKEIEPALYLLKKADDHQSLFICNFGTKFKDNIYDIPKVVQRTLAWDEVTVKLAADQKDKVFELDLLTGNIHAVESKYSGGMKVFKTSLPMLGSHLFITSKIDLATQFLCETPEFKGKVIELKKKKWQIETDDFNVVVLDQPEAIVDGVKQDKTFVLTLDDNLRKMLGVQPRCGHMVQPWLSAKAPKPKKTLDVVLNYSFDCAALPKNDCFLGIERPDLYEITFNGEKLKQDDRGYWCDLSMRRLKLASEFFQPGQNTVSFRCKYHQYLPGLEAFFILGRFGVSGNTIIAEPKKLTIGDWTKQGLQNYGGNVVYATTVILDGVEEKKYKLELGKWNGVALEISVNDSNWIKLPWPPFEADVSNLLKEGKNIIKIKVLGCRRNSHGPFYLGDFIPGWCGPAEMKDYRFPYKTYVAFGLFEPPVLKTSK